MHIVNKPFCANLPFVAVWMMKQWAKLQVQKQMYNLLNRPIPLIDLWEEPNLSDLTSQQI